MDMVYVRYVLCLFVFRDGVVECGRVVANSGRVKDMRAECPSDFNLYSYLLYFQALLSK